MSLDSSPDITHDFPPDRGDLHPLRMHVVSLPHTQTTHDYVTCAYTQKVVKFSKMMTKLGHEVILYSGEQNTAVCSEHVPIMTEAERATLYGSNDTNSIRPAFSWSPESTGWKLLNSRAAAEIWKRARPSDLLMLIAGTSHQPIANALPHLRALEWGVGYEGIFAKYRAFESYAWMHFVYGVHGIRQPQFLDTVVPNFFDPEDFYVSLEKEDYLLFVGRLTRIKGPHLAAQIAELSGRKLLLAGPGVTEIQPGKIVCDGVTVEGNHVEYIGPLMREERAKTMSRAAALLVPTMYVGPFEGVAVEAMFSGTPAIGPDFGAFTETIIPGITGERFNAIDEAVAAVDRVTKLDPLVARQNALDRFGLDAVGLMYDRWIRRILATDNT